MKELILGGEFGKIDVKVDKNGIAWMNASQMLRRFPEKRISDFYKNPEAIQEAMSIFEEINDNGNFRCHKNSNNDDVFESLKEVTVSAGIGKPSQTWFVEELAIEFAKWLDPAFGKLCKRKMKELLRYGVATLSDDPSVKLRQLESGAHKVIFENGGTIKPKIPQGIDTDYLKQTIASLENMIAFAKDVGVKGRKLVKASTKMKKGYTKALSGFSLSLSGADDANEELKLITGTNAPTATVYENNPAFMGAEEELKEIEDAASSDAAIAAYPTEEERNEFMRIRGIALASTINKGGVEEDDAFEDSSDEDDLSEYDERGSGSIDDQGNVKKVVFPGEMRELARLVNNTLVLENSKLDHAKPECIRNLLRDCGLLTSQKNISTMATELGVIVSHTILLPNLRNHKVVCVAEGWIDRAVKAIYGVHIKTRKDETYSGIDFLNLMGFTKDVISKLMKDVPPVKEDPQQDIFGSSPRP